MDVLTVGWIMIGLLLIFMAAGVPVGVTFISAGLICSYLLMGVNGSLSMLGQVAYHSVATPTWVCIPLFILMGGFAAIGGFAQRAYKSISVLAARLPGSLAIATCYACAAFGAMSGSSIATTAIFGRLSLPEMQRYGYDTRLSVGCIASAGTFASMIPPSMMFIIYAMFTQTSVAKLFAAGVVPGILTATVYAIYIYVAAKRNPKIAPMPPAEILNLAWKEKIRIAIQIWPILVIAILMMGGMYTGVFTATEAAAAGALFALALGWMLRDIRSLSAVVKAMKDSANTTAMLFLINIGALYYSRILAMTRVPTMITESLNTWHLSPLMVLIGVIIIMYFLGMIMVPVGIYALTLPIAFPLLVSMGYDPIWFGVIALKLTEIGCLTPPVGLNAFAMKGVVGKEISLETIFRGCMPFIALESLCLIILVIFPGISTWLPNLLFGN